MYIKINSAGLESSWVSIPSSSVPVLMTITRSAMQRRHAVGIHCQTWGIDARNRLGFQPLEQNTYVPWSKDGMRMYVVYGCL